jgi:glycogen debranching enzyme
MNGNEPAPAREPLRLHALKRGDTFVVSDPVGDILGDGDGLFDDDTRLLSHFRLLLGETTPSLLSTAISHDNVFFTANLSNRPLPPLGGHSLPEGVIHIERRRFLWQRHLHEQLLFTNYGQSPALVPLVLRFAADFRDMFEVRGSERAARGAMAPPAVAENGVRFVYHGLDGVTRQSRLTFSARPVSLTPEQAEFHVALAPDGTSALHLVIGPGDEPAPSPARFRAAAAQARASMWRERRRAARLATPTRLFNAWIDRSAADLALLTTELPTGPYPYAGIPWFSTTFGRDAIITALQTLWLDPRLAKGVLSFLAKTQATETSAFRDAEPGKIMHEARKGEMTALGELPFGHYYGGVDTTPLFLLLAGAYAARTGDLGFIATLWPSLLAALGWVERCADRNEHGFLTYARGAESGLANQGWKDSEDSVFHADGRFPDGPVALVEVQGYVFAALTAMAGLAERRGAAPEAERWRARAEALRGAVEAKFWMHEAGCYGIAIDGAGELCRVAASNAGQLLFSGLPAPERAARVAHHLLAPRFDSGWGIRTLARGAARFNPISYHNGSVWPHDTALCIAGLARYGLRDAVLHFTGQMFEAAVHFDMRLPELFCGFPRAAGEAPIAYPVACLPQAWSAGSVFMLLQSCLGLTVDGWQGGIALDRPALPEGVDILHLRGLSLGKDRIDLLFERTGTQIACLPRSHNGDAVLITRRD